ncbi:MAG: hypothetical protein MUO26_03190 [Methanotrichaceae archaeon]|nr:hypothetical protein [Methanotrichaceae archaeon]
MYNNLRTDFAAGETPTTSYTDYYGDKQITYTSVGLLLGTIKTEVKDITFSMSATDIEGIQWIFESMRIEGIVSVEKSQLKMKEEKIKEHAKKARANAPAEWFEHKEKWDEYNAWRNRSPSPEKSYTIPSNVSKAARSTSDMDSEHNVTDPSDPLYWAAKAEARINAAKAEDNFTIYKDYVSYYAKAIDLNDDEGNFVEVVADKIIELNKFVGLVIESDSAQKRDEGAEVLKWMLYDTKIFDKLIEKCVPEWVDPDLWRSASILRDKAETLEYLGDYKAASEYYRKASEAYDRDGVLANSTNYHAEPLNIDHFGYAVEMEEAAERTLAKAQELES